MEFTCINPFCRIGLIHKCSIDSHKLTWILQLYVLVHKCKQNRTSLSLLAGRIVHQKKADGFSPLARVSNIPEALEKKLNKVSEFTGSVNPFKPNGISHPYKMDESISNLRVFG